MITKMKKLTFLVYYKEYEAFLNGVRDLGVVHVAEKQQALPTIRSCRTVSVCLPACRLRKSCCRRLSPPDRRWRKHPPRQPADWKC